MPDKPILSLSRIDTETWTLLSAGSQNPKEAFYTGTLGTQTATGISLRTVVLREVFPAAKRIICYSDKRASKVQEIENQPNVSWLFWDSDKKIQLRLFGSASIHIENKVAEQYWNKTSSSNRRSYLALHAPGTLQDHPTSGLPEGLDNREPTQAESEAGRGNFAVIITTIHTIDWLHLASTGHRRALFTYENGKLSKASWIIP